MSRWTLSVMTEIPLVSDGEPGDPRWHPVQHALGIDTFGANLFVATRSEQTLVEQHDEQASGQQELYLVLEGEAVFTLDGEEVLVTSGAAVAVTDPSVRRSATARTSGTKLLVVGAADGPFTSTWNASHFDGVPRPD
jgi:hypothetical protein